MTEKKVSSYERVFVELSQMPRGFGLTSYKEGEAPPLPEAITDFTAALQKAEELCRDLEESGAQVNLTISAQAAGYPLQIQRQRRPSTVDVLDVTPPLGEAKFQVLAMSGERELASKEFPSLGAANWHADKVAEELLDLGHQVILTRGLPVSVNVVPDAALKLELERRGYFVHRPESDPVVDPLRHQRIKSSEDQEGGNGEREQEQGV